jgi:type II secretory pathway pseudopilin PulG
VLRVQEERKTARMRQKIALAGKRGATLLEATVVLAILSLLLASAVASVGGFVAQKTLAGWSDAIVNDIRGAQQLAITRRATAVVTFTGGPPAKYATTVGGTSVRGQTLPAEISVTTAAIQFNTLGVPVSGATVVLADARNGQSITISVSPVTGAVTTQ